MSQAPGPLLFATLQEQGWAEHSVESPGHEPPSRRPDGFLYAPCEDACSGSALEFSNDAFRATIRVEPTFSKRHQGSVRRVKVILHERATGKVAAYLRGYLAGLPEVGSGLARLYHAFEECQLSELSELLVLLEERHFDAFVTLKETFHLYRLLYVDLFEVAEGFQGRRLGVELGRAAFKWLASRHGALLAVYRPYPLQFNNDSALGTRFSHDRRAVAVRTAFLASSASLSAHYAKHWNSQRLPGTEYFLMSLNRAVKLLFHPAQERWALAPMEKTTAREG